MKTNFSQNVLFLKCLLGYMVCDPHFAEPTYIVHGV